MIKLRVFEVLPKPKGAVDLPKPVALEPMEVRGEGDVAKREAKAMLKRAGWLVRSVSWSPSTSQGPGPKPDMLLAYVSKGAP